LIAEGVCHIAQTKGRGVWVPAFAGTTAGVTPQHRPETIDEAVFPDAQLNIFLSALD
jgi:hypothetical protein